MSRIGTTTPVPDKLRQGLSSATTARSASLKVLVVDDNVDGAEMLGEYLRLLGHDVTIAHDGQGAIEAARRARPDVVFLDIGLPGMDGYEVARRLRSEGMIPLLVAVTGYGQAQDRHRAEEAGFDHHFLKPVDPAALKDLLAAIGAARA